MKKTQKLSKVHTEEEIEMQSSVLLVSAVLFPRALLKF